MISSCSMLHMQLRIGVVSALPYTNVIKLIFEPLFVVRLVQHGRPRPRHSVPSRPLATSLSLSLLWWPPPHQMLLPVSRNMQSKQNS